MTDLYPLLRPVLRKLDAEAAHRLTLAALRIGAGALWPAPRPSPNLAIRVLGRDFANPLGIAAGFDKDGIAAGALLRLGFGFVEVGTVTPRPQAGNPRPRLFRLDEDRGVINRMGFNNRGAGALAARFAKYRPRGLIGINIGANKESADRIADYVAAFKLVAPYADYIAVNVSSPNTPGLRNLQLREELNTLVFLLQEARKASTSALPLLVKVAPDLDAPAIADIAELALARKLEGLIIANTTLSRPALRGAHASEAGGLSGAPLFARSTEILADLYRLTKGRLTLIGVGGIGSPREAYEKILSGASLIELYTALVYQGPALVRIVLEGLSVLLASDGYAHVTDAVGAKSK